MSSARGSFVKIALRDGLVRRKDALLDAAKIQNSESQTGTSYKSCSLNFSNARTKYMVAKALPPTP